jgi:hypothetical protein
MQLQLGPSSIDLLAAPRFQSAFALLSEANSYAQRTSSDPWDFAVEIQPLRAVGLSDNDLRFLVRLKYVDHGREKKSSTYRDGRQFQATGNLNFADRTCFILTVKGMDAASVNVGKPSNGVSLGTPVIRISSAITRLGTATLPVWDAKRRVLFFDGKVVKQFRRRANNQELVLASFHEEDWPSRIYDPLSPQPCQDMKRRLNDTIKCLNRGQERPRLHFRGDGTGEGVLWDVVG